MFPLFLIIQNSRPVQSELMVRNEFSWWFTLFIVLWSQLELRDIHQFRPDGTIIVLKLKQDISTKNNITFSSFLLQERDQRIEQIPINYFHCFCFCCIVKMPLNNWNWYRAVGTGGDHKAWSGDNPQVTIFFKKFYHIP